MRKFLYPLFATFFLLSVNLAAIAQSCLPTNLNNTVVTIPCGAACTNLSFKVPHLKSTSNYLVNSIPYAAYSYLGGTEITSIYIDDKYSPLIPITFPFCFYEQTYSNIIVGSNGVVTFEAICAAASNAYTLTSGSPSAPQPLPYNVGAGPTGISTTYYPRTAIMGAYHDIDPSATPLPTRRIEYKVVGTAPCRKFVISFLDIRMFSCTDSIATQQIVIYESTGLVDVYLLKKPICATWPSGAGGGLAILGIQDETRTKFVAAPGKNATQWNENNTGYRFTPSGGLSNFVSAQLLDMSGAVIVAAADTTTTVAGMLDISFPNVCPTATSTQYVIKTTFNSCPAGSTMISLDTVTVNKSSALNLTTTSTPTTCGNSTGTITVTATGGVLPYQYSVDGGTLQSSSTLTGLGSGPHSVFAQDAAGCNNTVTVNVTAITSLPGTFTTTGTSCPGVNNGTITVVPGGGTAPYTYSLDGGTPQSSNIFTGVASGSHTVVFTDVNACSGTITTTVTAGAAITSTSTTIAVSCTGANNGSATVTPTSGTGPYTFSIDGGAFQTSGTFTGLTSGSHTVTIKDANNCTGTRTFTIGSGSGITSTQSNTLTSCPGVNNGTITIVPTNGTGPYTYSVNGGAYSSANPITGLAPGPYTITIRDVNGCTGTKAVTITQGTAIAGTSSSTNSSCPGANNGTITVIPVTGTAPYMYRMDGGAAQASNIFTGVAPGVHNMVLTDVNGCSASVSVTITAGAGIAGGATSTGASCPGVNNGTVTVTPTSGLAPFSYSIDGGASQLSNTFPGIAAGPHTVTFTDAGGCSATAPVTVASGTAITGTSSSTATACPGVNNGTATVSSVSGPAPYSYSIDGGSSQANATFNGLAAGNHVLGFTDGNGCTGTVNVTVAQGAALTGSATSTATSCPGVNNGTATVTSVSGPAPYTYTIDGGFTQTNATFTGLSAGMHTAGFTDANGCTGLVNISVGQGAPLTGTATSSNTSCPTVNNGTVTAIPSSGGAPYQYSINGGLTYQTAATFTGLSPNTYTITIKDNAGCTGTVSATVSAGSNIISSIVPVQPQCAFINDGSITINPSTGTAPYQYSLNGGLPQSNNVFPGLAPGSYTIAISDALGCTGSNSVNLTTNPPITSMLVKTMPLCNGGNNGSIIVSPTGGVAPYQYSINAGLNYQPGSTLSNLSAGSYVIRIKDNVGCIKDTAVTLAEPAIVTASATSSVATCAGNDGVVTITAGGGTIPYQFSLNGITYQPVNTITAPATGVYNNISVKDANGCIKTTSVTITFTDNVVLDAGPDSTICAEQTIILQPQVNPEVSNFRWIPNVAINDQGIKNPSVTPLVTTKYYVTATWGPCVHTDSLTVFVKNKPIADAGPDVIICDRDSTILTGSVTNVSGTVNYIWTPASTVRSDSNFTTIAVPVVTQVYTLTVTDNYGCNYRVQDQVKVTVMPPVPANAGQDTIAVLGSPHQLVATGGTQYSWSPAAPLNSPIIPNPLATISNDTKFTVVVRDVAGCYGYDTVFVKVYTGPTYYVPNAFSPNGDGLNDIFRPIPVGIAKTDYFRVFNRYGELIFETNEWLKGWDGTYKARKQPIGVYVWIIKGVDRKGTPIEMKGTVTLIQ